MSEPRYPGSEWLFLPGGQGSDGFTRRTFLRVTMAAGGGLLVTALPVEYVGTRSDPSERPRECPNPDGLQFLNAYVLVGTDGTITIRAPCPEIGQGVRTSLPMIVVEELAARWSDVCFEQAPADDRYGGMTVGGSDSVSDYWLPHRQAGALARYLLVASAAERWEVAPEECDV
ncbi:MAG: molybdopterin-dependent oxidoreductase, partial [Gemmatimonadota bacterium]